MDPKTYLMRAEWDEMAQVWVATSDDVPGLVTEASNMEHLIAKLRVLVPEMLEENGVLRACSSPAARSPVSPRT